MNIFCWRKTIFRKGDRMESLDYYAYQGKNLDKIFSEGKNGTHEKAAAC